MKKETTLSVLKEIRDILKAQHMTVDANPFALSHNIGISANTVSRELFIITDEGKLETSELLDLCRKKFDVWSIYDNDRLDKNFPPLLKPTTRKFKKVMEADEEHANKSAVDLEKEGVQGITLRERIIMEIQYFDETGKHLDVEKCTLCSGSRDSDGGVPGACWGPSGRKFCVDWCGPGGRNANLRARAVVS